ncbi:Gfo/Idh/MocA family oxidoreductase [Shigella flexneri]
MQSTDYFHAILSYPQRRVILQTTPAAAESARYIVHGSRGSYVKYGLIHRKTSQKWRASTAGRLGRRYGDGVLTRVEGEERVEETLLTVPGNYPAYYAAIRDALNGDGENPVSASRQSGNGVDRAGHRIRQHCATLCLA